MGDVSGVAQLRIEADVLPTLLRGKFGWLARTTSLHEFDREGPRINEYRFFESFEDNAAQE